VTDKCAFTDALGHEYRYGLSKKMYLNNSLVDGIRLAYNLRFFWQGA
jgi:hypothetical protein